MFRTLDLNICRNSLGLLGRDARAIISREWSTILRWSSTEQTFRKFHFDLGAILKVRNSSIVRSCKVLQKRQRFIEQVAGDRCATFKSWMLAPSRVSRFINMRKSMGVFSFMKPYRLPGQRRMSTGNTWANEHNVMYNNNIMTDRWILLTKRVANEERE